MPTHKYPIHTHTSPIHTHHNHTLTTTPTHAHNTRPPAAHSVPQTPPNCPLTHSTYEYNAHRLITNGVTSVGLKCEEFLKTQHIYIVTKLVNAKFSEN